ncbi:MAG: hypothetical protein V2J16_01260, partial [Thermoleophilia bacterium]|nr:hypothetical protein [Thermoleophilia bacterium]
TRRPCPNIIVRRYEREKVALRLHPMRPAPNARGRLSSISAPRSSYRTSDTSSVATRIITTTE